MRRTVGLAVVAAILGTVIGVVATLALDRDKAAAPQPDRVVGLVRRCTVVGRVRTGPPVDVVGENCDRAVEKEDGIVLTNYRTELTILTDKGTTYTVDVGPSTTVNVGDQWPPKP